MFFSISMKLCYANSVHLTEKINALDIMSPPLSVSSCCTTHSASYGPYKLTWFTVISNDRDYNHILICRQIFGLFLQCLRNKILLACVSLQIVA